MLRVQGLAASSLFDANDPLGPSNRRISIIVMNREAEDRIFRNGPEPPDAAEPIAPIPAAVVAQTPSTSSTAAR